MRDFAVIGLGRFGASVARSLHSLGYDVLGVDMNEAKVAAATEYTTKAVQCDATDENSLRSVGIRNFDAVVVAIGDLQASILITLLLKEMGVRRKPIIPFLPRENFINRWLGKLTYKPGRFKIEDIEN